MSSRLTTKQQHLEKLEDLMEPTDQQKHRILEIQIQILVIQIQMETNPEEKKRLREEKQRLQEIQLEKEKQRTQQLANTTQGAPDDTPPPLPHTTPLELSLLTLVRLDWW
jgi:hypothetical protein